MSSIFSSLRTSASALTAQRLRMDVIANNIANAETTRTADGGAYQREQVVFMPYTPDNAQPPAVRAMAQGGLQAVINRRDGQTATPLQGVKVQRVMQDETPGQRVYNPGHPDADEEGFVTMPNVDVVTEMTDMLSATRSYEANITVFNAIKSMAIKALELGRS